MSEKTQYPKALCSAWPCLFVFSFAFVLRILHLLFIAEPMVFMKYPFFAEKLALGESIGTRLVDLSPFYLYFMTLLKRFFFMDVAHVQILQALVGALNCVLVYALGARIFTKEVGLLASCIMAAYGNIIILGATFEPEVFVLSFGLLTVIFLARSSDDASYRKAMVQLLWAGFFAGLTIITKPNFLLFLPVGAFWIAFVRESAVRFSRRFWMASCFVCASLMVVFPITLRNYVVFYDFILVTADGGKVFFHGNGEGATALEGTGLPDEGFAEEGAGEPDYAHVLFRKTAQRLTGKDLSPSQASKYWTNRAVTHIRQNFKSHMVLVAKKFFYFFNDYEMHFIASAYNEYKASLKFPFLRYGAIASLGLLGMALGVIQFKKFFLPYGMVAVYLVSCLLFLVTARYRMPAVPFVCLFAGHAVVSLKAMFLEKRWKTAIVSLVALALLFMTTSLAYRSEIERIDIWQTATKTYYQRDALSFFQQGQFDEAIAALDQCTAMLPQFAPAINLRGRALGALGRYDRAREEFEKVVALSPQLPNGYENLGFVYLLQGDTQQAKRFLVKAQLLDPNRQKVNEALAQLE